MFLDYIKAPGWVFGAVGVGVVVLWVAFFHKAIVGKEVDILEGK